MQEMNYISHYDGMMAVVDVHNGTGWIEEEEKNFIHKFGMRLQCVRCFL